MFNGFAFGTIFSIFTMASPPNNDAMLLGIQKESCYIAGVVKHQKGVLHEYADGNAKYSNEDLIRIEIAQSTIDTEQLRMEKLQSRYRKITHKELTWKDCKGDEK